MQKNKEFECTVEFEVISFTIKAKNKTEARKKLMARLGKVPATKYIDKKKLDIMNW